MRPTGFLRTALLAVMLTLIGSSMASAGILISINKNTQRMTVTVDGVQRYTWKVSTGAPGYATPSGTYTPFRLEKDHFSKEWDEAPMPNSIFFTTRGHAIHGSYSRSIGRAASHGCVRLEPRNAAKLYSLVERKGLGNTKVVITGGGMDTPVADAFGSVRREAKKVKRQFGMWLRDDRRR